MQEDVPLRCLAAPYVACRRIGAMVMRAGLGGDQYSDSHNNSVFHFL